MLLMGPTLRFCDQINFLCVTGPLFPVHATSRSNYELTHVWKNLEYKEINLH